MLTGGFMFPSLEVLPTKGNALPAFTPVYADEEARTIVPLYVFEVKAVDGTKVSVVKNEEGTRAMFHRERRSRERYNLCVAEDMALPTGSFFDEDEIEKAISAQA